MNPIRPAREMDVAYVRLRARFTVARLAELIEESERLHPQELETLIQSQRQEEVVLFVTDLHRRHRLEAIRQASSARYAGELDHLLRVTVASMISRDGLLRVRDEPQLVRDCSVTRTHRRVRAQHRAIVGPGSPEKGSGHLRTERFVSTIFSPAPLQGSLSRHPELARARPIDRRRVKTQSWKDLRDIILVDPAYLSSVTRTRNLCQEAMKSGASLRSTDPGEAARFQREFNHLSPVLLLTHEFIERSMFIRLARSYDKARLSEFLRVVEPPYGKAEAQAARDHLSGLGVPEAERKALFRQALGVCVRRKQMDRAAVLAEFC